MPTRRCLDCTALTTATRCTLCTRRHKQIRNADRPIARQVIANHLAEHGPTCPGYQRPPHPVNPADLTADHTTPLARGGTNTGPRAALCRSCNSAKRDR